MTDSFPEDLYIISSKVSQGVLLQPNSVSNFRGALQVLSAIADIAINLGGNYDEALEDVIIALVSDVQDGTLDGTNNGNDIPLGNDTLDNLDDVLTGDLIDSSPAISAVPSQAALTNSPFQLNVCTYVDDDATSDADLVLTVTAGNGQFVGCVYEHTFTAAGTFQIDFDVQDEGCNTSSSSFSIQVQEKPVVLSVVADVDELQNGGDIAVTFTVQSPIQPDYLSSAFTGPVGSIYGGGSGGRNFQSIGPNTWSYTWIDTISPYAQSGDYYYSNVSVMTLGGVASEVFDGAYPHITVTNSAACPAPTIDSISLDQALIEDGGTVTFTIEATSSCPMDWLVVSHDGPNGSIFGGGSPVPWVNTSGNSWQYSREHTVSEWAPDGAYTFSNIRVRNEGQLWDTWQGVNPTFTVNNALEAETPVILNAWVTPTTLNGGGEFDFFIEVSSNAPATWLLSSFTGPNGNIWGGGSVVPYTEISPGVWRYSFSRTISADSPAGDYYLHNISVTNEGQLASGIWLGPTPTVVNQ